MTAQVYGEHAYGGGAFSATAISGVAASGQVGSLSLASGSTLAGLAASGVAGSPSFKIDVGAILGVSGQGATGVILFGGQNAITGVAAAGHAGTLAFGLSCAISGVSAAGVVALTSAVSPTIQGVSARGSAGYIDTLDISIPFGLAGWSGYVPHSADDYGYAFADLLPRGQAWPRDTSTTLMGVVFGLADYYGFVDQRASTLLEIESDPRKTHELLPDWERAWGLPDPCLTAPQTEDERRIALVAKMTMLGAQSRQWFWQFSRKVVGTQIYIQEFAPFTCGISQVGDTRPGPEGGWEEGHYRWEIGPPEIRFFWRVRPLGKTLHWFRCARDHVGIDPMCRILPDTALECILRRLKPAQTEIVFDYSLSTEE